MKCALALSLAGMSTTVPLAAQIGIGGDIAAPSRYVWRGLTRSQAVIVQPSIYVATGGTRDSLRAGVWTSWDLTSTRADQLSDRGPGLSGLTETNVWLHYQREQGPHSLALGVVDYRFQDDAASARRNRRWNTTELYASVHARGLRIAPRLDAWWDVDQVRGWYFEGSASIPVLGNIEGAPFWAIYLRALAGYSAGQERNRGRPEELAYFSSPGLTHVLLGASTNLSVPGVSVLGDRGALLLDLNAQINRDRATKVTDADSPPTRKRVKLWATLSASIPALRLF